MSTRLLSRDLLFGDLPVRRRTPGHGADRDRPWRRHRAPDEVDIRPLQPGDVDSVATVLLGLTPQDRWFRFGRAMPRLEPSMLATLAGVDGTSHIAVTAVADDVPIGMARLVRLRDEPHVAEIAVSVASDHKGRGIGTALVREVLAGAAALGIEVIECYVVDGNERALRLFRSFGFRFSVDDGDYHARLPVAAVSGAA